MGKTWVSSPVQSQPSSIPMHASTDSRISQLSVNKVPRLDKSGNVRGHSSTNARQVGHNPPPP